MLPSERGAGGGHTLGAISAVRHGPGLALRIGGESGRGSDHKAKGERGAHQ